MRRMDARAGRRQRARPRRRRRARRAVRVPPRAAVPIPLPAFELPWMGLPPGTWTDDTAMARNLWRSLLAHDGALDVDDVLARHLAWLATRPARRREPDARRLSRAARGRAGAGASRVRAARPRGERRERVGDVLRAARRGVRAREPERLLERGAGALAAHALGRALRTACLAVTLAGRRARPRRRRPSRAVVGARRRRSRDREGGEELEYLVDEAGRARPIDGPDMGFTLFTRRDRAPGRRRGPSVRGRASPRRRARRRHRHERGGGGRAARRAHGRRRRSRRVARPAAEREAIEAEARALAALAERRTDEWAGPAEEAHGDARRPPRGREERRVVTAVFADLVGSTALGERLDPEELKLVVGDAVARIDRRGRSVRRHDQGPRRRRRARAVRRPDRPRGRPRARGARGACGSSRRSPTTPARSRPPGASRGSASASASHTGRSSSGRSAPGAGSSTRRSATP